MSMICPKCSTENAEGTSYCIQCGADLLPAPEHYGLPPVLPKEPAFQQTVTPRTSGFAIAALVFGVLSCIPGVFLLGLAFGIVALVQIGRSKGALTGNGLAIGGLVCSVLIGLIAIVAALLFPVFGKAREKARQTNCISNQRQIALAAQMYAQDHNETLPSSATFWNDIQVPAKLLVCPTSKTLANGYGYNADLSKKKLGNISDPSVILLSADATGANNLITSVQNLDMRHEHRFIASYLDGHVEMPKSTAGVKLK